MTTDPDAYAHLTGWGMYAPERRPDQRRSRADGRHLRRVDRQPDRHPRAPRRRGPRDHGLDGGRRRHARRSPWPGIEPDDIDLILVATLTPDYWMPATAALVKEAIGNTRAAAMDVAAACSGFVYGYATAHAYIRSGHGTSTRWSSARSCSPASSTSPTEHVHPVRRRRRAPSSCPRPTSRAAACGHRADDRPRRAPT